MSSSLGPLERRALPDLVAERLMNAIENGDYKAGDQLPTEPELARQIGVGRTSLREAIQRLRILGLVEVRSGLGTFVVDRGRSDPIMAFATWAGEHEFEISEVFEARMALEVAATEHAVQRATVREVAKLKSAAKAHISAQKTGSINELVRTDEEFHALLVALSRNTLMARLYGMLVPELVQYRHVSLALPGSAERSGTDHTAIVEALTARDITAATRAVTEHLSVLSSEVSAAATVTRKKHRSRGAHGA